LAENYPNEALALGEALSSSGSATVNVSHPAVEFRANPNSIFHRCHLVEVAFAWELTEETTYLPLGCFQG